MSENIQSIIPPRSVLKFSNSSTSFSIFLVLLINSLFFDGSASMFSSYSFEFKLKFLLCETKLVIDLASEK